jgi:predicted RNase H-like HicB family nuclease
MIELQYTYWKSTTHYIGYLNNYPDHLTQGKDLPELEEMLLDLYEMIKEEEPITAPHSQVRLLVAV